MTTVSAATIQSALGSGILSRLFVQFMHLKCVDVQDNFALILASGVFIYTTTISCDFYITSAIWICEYCDF